MPTPQPHIVLVARPAGEPNVDAETADARFLRLQFHHALLQTCVNEAFGVDPVALGTCDDNAVLLCEADRLPLIVQAASRFIQKLREQDEYPSVSSQLGLADGVERWEPGTPWRPQVFGTAVTAAQQLADIARVEQIVCLDRLRERVDLSAVAPGLRWGDPLTTTLSGGPREVAAIARDDADGSVWNVQELRANLQRAATQTSAALHVLAIVDTKLERISRDYGILGEILSTLNMHTDTEVRIEISPSPFRRLHAAVDSSPQLGSLAALNTLVPQMWAQVQKLRSSFHDYRNDFAQEPDGPAFRTAHVVCKEIIGGLREQSERANDQVLRLIDETALRAAIQRSIELGTQADAA